MDKKDIIRIACLQLEARPFDAQAENKKNILDFIRQAGLSKPDLIVLPECVYPCYFLSPRIIDNYTTLSVLTEQFLAEIKENAKKYRTFIAIGLPEYSQKENTLFNSAFLIDEQGQEIGRVRKSFLWHFDHHWFESDDQYPVFDTKIGKIGLFVCADGRLPEILRCLALQGAGLLLDLTNWVTSGLDRKKWTNPQAEYMIPTRALENKVWIVAANKVGMEEKSIQYCGKSAFFSPEGKVITMASTDKEEIIIEDIDLRLSHDKKISGSIHVFKDRHPEKYDLLTLPYGQLSALPEKNNKSKKVAQNPLTAIIQTEDSSDLEKYLQKMEYFFHTLTEQEANLFCFSQNRQISPNKSQQVIDLLKKLTKNTPALCCVTLYESEEQKKFKIVFLIESGKITGKYRKTHLEISEQGQIAPGKDFRVYPTRFGRVGMMLDYEGYFPEIARILTLKGAQIIIWPCRFSHDEQVKISQTRGAENKIFVICPNAIGENANGHSLVVSPSGHIIAGCLENSEMATIARIDVKIADDKMIVPHTHAILGRHPTSYHLLTMEKNNS